MNPIPQEKSYMMTEHNCGSKSQYNGPEVITSIADLKWNMTLWHFNDPRYLHKRIDHTTNREARKDQKILLTVTNDSPHGDRRLRAKYDNSTLTNIRRKMVQAKAKQDQALWLLKPLIWT